MSSKSNRIESHGSVSIQKTGSLYVDANGAYNAVSAPSAQHFVTAGTNLVLGSGAGSSITLNPGTGGVVIQKAAPVTQATNLATGVVANGAAGFITTQTASTAGATLATFLVSNSAVTATSIVDLKLVSYSGVVPTNGIPQVSVSAIGLTGGIGGLVPGFTVNVYNAHASNVLAGTLKIAYLIF